MNLISVSDIETIEELASKNYAINEIALFLDVKPSELRKRCLDTTDVVGKAFNRGLLEIDRKKKQALLDNIFKGSETAIQIHDKKAEQQAFKDIKADIFSDPNE